MPDRADVDPVALEIDGTVSMTFRFFECWLAIVSVSMVVLALRTRYELKRIEKKSPDTLSEAGIAEIDWWWKCLRGIYRLGFTEKGRGLSLRTKSIFKGFVVSYALFVSTIVVLCALRISLGNLVR